MITQLRKEMKKMVNTRRALSSLKFFKTQKGEYGYGDKFLGLTVPQTRRIAKEFNQLSLKEVLYIFKSQYHEERLAALFILINQFKKGDEKKKQEIFNLYLKYRKWVNNWDLVDSSAPYICGEFLVNKERDILYTLAKSEVLWDKRIAIISTLTFIKRKDCTDALKIAAILAHDSHDLIHKAVGWMLREVGNYCGRKQEEAFLKKYYKTMPRTMLRYAIEKFPETKRQAYLKGNI